MPMFDEARVPSRREVVGRLPWVTAAVATASGMLILSPSLSAALAFDRSALAAGAWWQLLTCHLTHWSASHVLWDTGVFACLGTLCEGQSRRRYAACLLTAAIAIALVVWAAIPEMERYRGLSGVDATLFAMILVRWTAESWRRGATSGMGIGVAVGGGFVGKVIYEAATGEAIFVDSDAAGFVAVPLAHAVGAAIGAGCAIGPRRRDRVR